MRCSATLVDLHFVCTASHRWWRVALRHLDNSVLCLYLEYVVTNVCWRFGYEFCTLRCIGAGVLDLYYERAMVQRFIF